MTIALIVLASLASIILINALPLIETFKDLLYFQKETIKVISKADFSDEKKQKILLVNSGKILFSTLKQIILKPKIIQNSDLNILQNYLNC